LSRKPDAGERRRKPQRQVGDIDSAQQAGLQPIASARSRHHDGYEGTTNFTQQFAVNGQRGRGGRLRHGRRRFERSGNGRRDVFQLQCGCGQGDPVVVQAGCRQRSGAGAGRVHGHQHALGARMNCTGRCSSFLRNQAWTRGTSSTARRRKTRSASRLPAERVRVYTGRAAGARRTARAPQDDIFRGVSRVPAGVGHNAGDAGADSSRAQGNRTPRRFRGTRCMCPLTRSWPAFLNRYPCRMIRRARSGRGRTRRRRRWNERGPSSRSGWITNCRERTSCLSGSPSTTCVGPRPIRTRRPSIRAFGVRYVDHQRKRGGGRGRTRRLPSSPGSRR